LLGLRALCDRFGALLIFDEVITGFRLGLGGAQGLFGVTPDLTTFGKIIGGGLPVGAYGGRRDILDRVAPQGPVYQAGTLSGNPLAMAAGIAMLDALAQPGFYEPLTQRTGQLVRGLNAAFTAAGHPAFAYHVGSIFGMWFKAGAQTAPRNYEQARAADTRVFAKFFHALLDNGVALAPSAFEVGFVSAAHAETHVEATVAAVERALTSLG
jgi:glutamate-1-semialdehyde 2,1-aminomutase